MSHSQRCTSRISIILCTPRLSRIKFSLGHRRSFPPAPTPVGNVRISAPMMPSGPTTVGNSRKTQRFVGEVGDKLTTVLWHRVTRHSIRVTSRGCVKTQKVLQSRGCCRMGLTHDDLKSIVAKDDKNYLELEEGWLRATNGHFMCGVETATLADHVCLAEPRNIGTAYHGSPQKEDLRPLALYPHHPL